MHKIIGFVTSTNQIQDVLNNAEYYTAEARNWLVVAEEYEKKKPELKNSLLIHTRPSTIQNLLR